jgi:hypothetical protein
MKWISCLPAHIDRLACSWLIKRFIDLEAEFIFVPKEKVIDHAKRMGATSYEISGAELSMKGEICTFDNLLTKYKLQDKVLQQLAVIVRGAKIDWPDLPNQTDYPTELSFHSHDAHTMLENRLEIFEALYSWGKLVAKEKPA